MLEKYKDGQPIVYNILNNAIKNNKLSHAYLFDSNGNSNIMDIVLSFAKMIITSDVKNEEEKKLIYKRIDDDNYMDIKIIEPDGMWIKKNQLIDLQTEFSKKAIEGKKKIYIIKSSEKMNPQTANSLLKFLEEPVDDIIAILIVNNINTMLSTIISRCQLIKLKKKKYVESSVDNFSNLYSQTKYNNLSNEEKNKIIDDVINFISFLEEKKIDSIIYVKKMWHSNFNDRESSLVALNLCIYFYNDVIKYINNLDVSFFKDKLNDIEGVANNNTLSSVMRKINTLDNFEYYLQKNLNVNLLIDEMIIEMCGE